MATQAERSAEMRERLLDATVATLVDHGYSGASLPEICRRAGVSRGAQLHHFPTKEALIATAVEHVVTKRFEEVRQRLSRAETLDLTNAGALLWSAYASPSFYAWLELVVAARTDKALREIVSGVDARFTQRAEQLVSTVLLPGVKDRAEIAATTRLILAIFDGLATHQIAAKDNKVARAALRVASRRGLFAAGG